MCSFPEILREQIRVQSSNRDTLANRNMVSSLLLSTTTWYKRTIRKKNKPTAIRRNDFVASVAEKKQTVAEERYDCCHLAHPPFSYASDSS